MVTSLGADSHQPEANGHQWLATMPSVVRARLVAAGAKLRLEMHRARELAAALNRSEHMPSRVADAWRHLS